MARVTVAGRPTPAVSPSKRALGPRPQIMARIRSQNTRPELVTRSILHGLGYRFRANVKTLPGRPDIAIKNRRVAIFVHGCFWHAHQDCRLNRPPKRNVGYWGPKLRRNAQRDAVRIAELKQLGYRVLVVWECEVAQRHLVEAKLRQFLLPADNLVG